MKKAYVQPDIVFESFSLSTNIAAACANNVHTQYTGVCGVPFGKKMIFLMGVSGCYTQIPDGDPMHESLCYHIPVEDNKLFNS